MSRALSAELCARQALQHAQQRSGRWEHLSSMTVDNETRLVCSGVSWHPCISSAMSASQSTVTTVPPPVSISGRLLVCRVPKT